MAKRISLREFQTGLTERLTSARRGEAVTALLGVISGKDHCLLELFDSGEVLPLPNLAPVPLTRAWFAGLASVHGELQAVVDFSIFCGGTATPRSPAARLLCVGPRFGSNAALLVERVHGLKRADVLFPADDDPADLATTWHGMAFTDTQGMRWTRLEVDHLLADPEFLDAALPDSAGQ